MKNLNEQEFQEFIKSEEKVVVDFFAEWCAPCKAMLPLLEQAEQENVGRIAKLNVDENRELASQFGITSIPTLLTFQNGELVNKKVGAVRKATEISLLLN